MQTITATTLIFLFLTIANHLSTFQIEAASITDSAPHFHVQPPSEIWVSHNTVPYEFQCVAEPAVHIAVHCPIKENEKNDPLDDNQDSKQEDTVSVEGASLEDQDTTLDDGIREDSPRSGQNQFRHQRRQGPHQPRLIMEGEKLTLTHTILFEEVEAWFGDYLCRCVAWNNDLTTQNLLTTVTSTSHVRAAYIGEKISVIVPQTVIKVGENMTLYCQPPEATPQVQIVWYFQSEGSVSSEKVSSEGNSVELHLHNMTVSHSGRYSCSATNIAGSRRSPPVHLKVYSLPYTSAWSTWSDWSACPSECWQNKAPQQNGLSCRSSCRQFLTKRSRTCNTHYGRGDGAETNSAACEGAIWESKTCDVLCPEPTPAFNSSCSPYATRCPSTETDEEAFEVPRPGMLILTFCMAIAFLTLCSILLFYLLRHYYRHKRYYSHCTMEPVHHWNKWTHLTTPQHLHFSAIHNDISDPRPDSLLPNVDPERISIKLKFDQTGGKWIINELGITVVIPAQAIPSPRRSHIIIEILQGSASQHLHKSYQVFSAILNIHMATHCKMLKSIVIAFPHNAPLSENNTTASNSSCFQLLVSHSPQVWKMPYPCPVPYGLSEWQCYLYTDSSLLGCFVSRNYCGADELNVSQRCSRFRILIYISPTATQQHELPSDPVKCITIYYFIIPDRDETEYLESISIQHHFVKDNLYFHNRIVGVILSEEDGPRRPVCFTCHDVNTGWHCVEKEKYQEVEFSDTLHSATSPAHYTKMTFFCSSSLDQEAELSFQLNISQNEMCLRLENIAIQPRMVHSLYKSKEFTNSVKFTRIHSILISLTYLQEKLVRELSTTISTTRLWRIFIQMLGFNSIHLPLNANISHEESALISLLFFDASCRDASFCSNLRMALKSIGRKDLSSLLHSPYICDI